MTAPLSPTDRPPLPLLDLARLDGAAADRALFLSELRAAIRRFGAFYVTGHGVDQVFLDSVFALSRRFFTLPEHHPQRVKQPSPGHRRAGFARRPGPPPGG